MPHAFRPLSSVVCALSSFFRPRPLALSPMPSSSGFTLIEVLVSLSILSIALVAVLHNALSVQDVFISTQSRERCAMLAEFKLNQSKILGVDNMVQGQGEFEHYPGFMWEVRIDPTRVQELTAITVTAYPKGGDRKAQGITLREYMYEPGRDTTQ